MFVTTIDALFSSSRPIAPLLGFNPRTSPLPACGERGPVVPRPRPKDTRGHWSLPRVPSHAGRRCRQADEGQ
ncbi:hypothetical protein C7U60_20655 [Mesorhizobium plurifarium]|nr:hypothetical protein C7U60_20655 [Mesorhizobium plurifarium]